jgi:2-iminobutanoate/2-iminopropanoate deaminase
MQLIHSDNAPAAIGPYSQAVKVNGFLFLSGQIPVDPATGALVEGDAVKQTTQVMKNLGAVLAADGLSFNDVARCDIFLASMDDFAAVNNVYASFFNGEHKPARQTVEVSCLPKSARVEISCIAVCKK